MFSYRASLMSQHFLYCSVCTSFFTASCHFCLSSPINASLIDRSFSMGNRRNALTLNISGGTNIGLEFLYGICCTSMACYFVSPSQSSHPCVALLLVLRAEQIFVTGVWLKIQVPPENIVCSFFTISLYSIFLFVCTEESLESRNKFSLKHACFANITRCIVCR